MTTHCAKFDVGRASLDEELGNEPVFCRVERHGRLVRLDLAKLVTRSHLVPAPPRQQFALVGVVMVVVVVVVRVCVCACLCVCVCVCVVREGRWECE